MHGLILKAIQALNLPCHIYMKHISLKIWVLEYLKLEFNGQLNLS